MLSNNADMCRFYDNNTLLYKPNKNRMECSNMKLTFKTKFMFSLIFFAESCVDSIDNMGAKTLLVLINSTVALSSNTNCIIQCNSTTLFDDGQWVLRFYLSGFVNTSCFVFNGGVYGKPKGSLRVATTRCFRKQHVA